MSLTKDIFPYTRIQPQDTPDWLQSPGEHIHFGKVELDIQICSSLLHAVARRFSFAYIRLERPNLRHSSTPPMRHFAPAIPHPDHHPARRDHVLHMDSLSPFVLQELHLGHFRYPGDHTKVWNQPFFEEQFLSQQEYLPIR